MTQLSSIAQLLSATKNLHDAQDILGLIKTTPQNARPLNLVYAKLTEALAAIDSITERMK